MVRSRLPPFFIFMTYKCPMHPKQRSEEPGKCPECGMDLADEKSMMKGHDHSHHIKMFRDRFWISLILTIPILLLSEFIQGIFGFSLTSPFQTEIVIVLSAIIYFYGGWPFLKGTKDELEEKQPGMMTLIGMAISVAFFYSIATIFFIPGKVFFWELATLIVVMLFGHWMEMKSVMGASRALEELVKIIPSTAHKIIKDDETEEIPVSELKKDDIVLVKPGEKIPSDGFVIEGESYVDESLVTGESKPVHKIKNSEVIGGSINQDGSLKVRIEKIGEETYISQVIDMVKSAQESKSKTQDLANRAAALLFYVALISGVITYLTWFLLGRPDFALEKTIGVLVIACPHALGLAIPLVVSLSTSITAKNGILIRNRTSFENARNVNAIIFDKTGTLTKGEFDVTDIVEIKKKKNLLGITASVENNSEHIIAKAIVNHAKKEKVKIPKSSKFKSIPGKGVYATVNKKKVHVGGPNLLKELDIDFENEKINKLEKEGKTVVFTIIDKEVIGAFALSDTIRDESYQAINDLKKLGIKVYMLTGDSEDVAESVSNELGIDDYFAEVLPHEKANKVKELQKEGYRVAMVGDGVNDAPALATADVGIAIGAGTDVAIESADIILVKNNPSDVSKAMSLSKKTYSKMVQNLWWAGGYNIIAIPLAAGVLYSYGINMTPAFGALLMSISTVVVAINAQTLRKYA